MISLLLLNNFYPVISYRQVQKRKKATNYRIRFRSLVMVRNQLPAQVVKLTQIDVRIDFFFLFFLLTRIEIDRRVSLGFRFKCLTTGQHI